MLTEELTSDEKKNSNSSWANRPASIAILCDSSLRAWTSQEELHLRLCQALQGLGITPVLVYAVNPPQEVQHRLRNGGAQIEVANYHQDKYSFVRKLGRIIDKYSISMVHICYFDYFSPIPWLARTLGIDRIVFEQLNGGILRAKSWRKKLVQIRAAITTYPVTRVIAISHFINQELVKSGVHEDKIAVRYLGIDTVRFSPNFLARERLSKDFVIQPDDLVLSTVSLLRPIKDPETIVRACGLLAERGVSIRLFVAGDGEMLAELEQLADACGIADRTYWLGYCYDPTSLLQASDVFVLASIGEAFGFVLAEAMACGVPVVGSRIGAIPEVVQEGQTGFLATAGDPVAFADAIEKLAKDKRLRHEMGLNGIERVRREFDVNLYVENTLRIYESL